MPNALSAFCALSLKRTLSRAYQHSAPMQLYIYINIFIYIYHNVTIRGSQSATLCLWLCVYARVVTASREGAHSGEYTHVRLILSLSVGPKVAIEREQKRKAANIERLRERLRRPLLARNVSALSPGSSHPQPKSASSSSSCLTSEVFDPWMR